LVGFLFVSNRASAPAKTEKDEEAQQNAVTGLEMAASPEEAPERYKGSLAMTKKKWWVVGIAISILVIFVIGLSVGLSNKHSKSNNDEPDEPDEPDEYSCDHAGSWCSSGSTCCSGSCFYNSLTGMSYCWGF
jgi:hypothetical protein